MHDGEDSGRTIHMLELNSSDGRMMRGLCTDQSPRQLLQSRTRQGFSDEKQCMLMRISHSFFSNDKRVSSENSELKDCMISKMLTEGSESSKSSYKSKAFLRCPYMILARRELAVQ